ncbi:glycosyl transferase [Hydrogenophaga crassostreae]|uniref:Glycosyl transferase n=1 Tax=Hydrogenophaga crassostreae TaxID=1763535 RepID=A0A162SYV5_9BURK|nr:glycosyltransferase family A protein [Hydrogenophaga crassostreae]AOW13500.1 glycosyl transferase [Hydrogenophaga crassostreae]OAD41791.1 glycosyl transferase [Hydrogenophaga crassostreae]
MREYKLGVVAIGRNEGERLRRCLGSVPPVVLATVYVDSGSDDGSKQMAIEMGADVLDLDMSRPFTAARARNEGLRRLLERHPEVDFVQFVDGDCEIVPDWLEAARDFLAMQASHAVVCGRRRERFPEHSVYNQMCDEEWNTPVGDTLSCGGDAMMRTQALQAVGGYRETLIAGEEPELCVRLRQKGWRIHRLDREMTLHDAAITRFSQWWKRTVRAGHAFAEGAWLHGAPPERHWVRETRRACFWGMLLPLLIAIATFGLGPWALALILVYPLQWLRLFWRSGSARSSTFMLIGKFAEAWGVLKFHILRLRGIAGPIIEYK